MEDDFLQWISIIPGVGPRRAKRLMDAGFTSPESICAASVAEIAQIEGIGRELAQRLKDYADEIVKIKEEETFLLLCPECSAFVSATAKRCEVCGATFEEGSPVERRPAPGPEVEEEDAETSGLFMCPACGRFIGADVRECPHCGVTFEEEPEREEDLEK
ncbi:MAG: helix-hairpin-helix domain-containing protein, partial [Thermoplasmata archaeon]|nr:helix-hairpin-helix domain-containing protein [Thermoplasmata archaeon]